MVIKMNSKKKKSHSFVKQFQVFFTKERPESKKGTILVNGKLLVFWACSIISALINLIFISNLTKSPYTIGTVFSIPAAIFLGALSVGLDLSKALHVVQVNTLNELYRKLSDNSWAEIIKKVSKKWNSVYMLYVILSIITSISLSTISIGAGITRNANTLKQIDELIQTGEMYKNIDNTSKNISKENLIKNATDTTEADARTYTQQHMNIIRPLVEDYKEERADFDSQGISFNDPEASWKGENASKYWDKKNSEVNRALQNAGYGKVNGTQIKNLNLGTVERTILNNRLSNTKLKDNDAAVEKLNELSTTTMDEAYGWLETLNTIGFTNPKTGGKVVFDINKEKQTKVLLTSALTQLKALRVEVENDSGDIGSSSKIFMQLGSVLDGLTKKDTNDLNDALKNTKATGSFGSTEVLMMLMLLFLSLLCELAINQFSPKVGISRKMMSQFSQYFPKDFDINEFMLQCTYEARDYDEIDDKEFQKQLKYCQLRINAKNDAKKFMEDVCKVDRVSTISKKENVESKRDTEFNNPKINELIEGIREELKDDREANNRNPDNL